MKKLPIAIVLSALICAPSMSTMAASKDGDAKKTQVSPEQAELNSLLSKLSKDSKKPGVDKKALLVQYRKDVMRIKNAKRKTSSDLQAQRPTRKYAPQSDSDVRVQTLDRATKNYSDSAPARVNPKQNSDVDGVRYSAKERPMDAKLFDQAPPKRVDPRQAELAARARSDSDYISTGVSGEKKNRNVDGVHYSAKDRSTASSVVSSRDPYARTQAVQVEQRSRVGATQVSTGVSGNKQNAGPANARYATKVTSDPYARTEAVQFEQRSRVGATQVSTGVSGSKQNAGPANARYATKVTSDPYARTEAVQFEQRSRVGATAVNTGANGQKQNSGPANARYAPKSSDSSSAVAAGSAAGIVGSLNRNPNAVAAPNPNSSVVRGSNASGGMRPSAGTVKGTHAPATSSSRVQQGGKQPSKSVADLRRQQNFEARQSVLSDNVKGALERNGTGTPEQIAQDRIILETQHNEVQMEAHRRQTLRNPDGSTTQVGMSDAEFQRRAQNFETATGERMGNSAAAEGLAGDQQPKSNSSSHTAGGDYDGWLREGKDGTKPTTERVMGTRDRFDNSAAADRKRVGLAPTERPHSQNVNADGMPVGVDEASFNRTQAEMQRRGGMMYGDLEAVGKEMKNRDSKLGAATQNENLAHYNEQIRQSRSHVAEGQHLIEQGRQMMNDNKVGSEGYRRGVEMTEWGQNTLEDGVKYQGRQNSTGVDLSRQAGGQRAEVTTKGRAAVNSVLSDPEGRRGVHVNERVSNAAATMENSIWRDQQNTFESLLERGQHDAAAEVVRNADPAQRGQAMAEARQNIYERTRAELSTVHDPETSARLAGEYADRVAGTESIDKTRQSMANNSTPDRFIGDQNNWEINKNVGGDKPPPKPGFMDNPDGKLGEAARAGQALDGRVATALGVGELAPNASALRSGLNRGAEAGLGVLGAAVAGYEVGKETGHLVHGAVGMATAETDAEFDKAAAEAEGAGQNLGVIGTLGVVGEVIPTTMAVAGAGAAGYMGGRYVLENTETGKAVDEWAGDKADRTVRTGEHAYDGLNTYLGGESKEQRADREFAAIQNQIMNQIRTGVMELEEGKTSQEMIEIARINFNQGHTIGSEEFNRDMDRYLAPGDNYGQNASELPGYVPNQADPELGLGALDQAGNALSAAGESVGNAVNAAGEALAPVGEAAGEAWETITSKPGEMLDGAREAAENASESFWGMMGYESDDDKQERLLQEARKRAADREAQEGLSQVTYVDNKYPEGQNVDREIFVQLGQGEGPSVRGVDREIYVQLGEEGVGGGTYVDDKYPEGKVVDREIFVQVGERGPTEVEWEIFVQNGEPGSTEVEREIFVQVGEPGSTEVDREIFVQVGEPGSTEVDREIYVALDELESAGQVDRQPN